MGKDKVSSYLLYAIGEILLVVIGILIAVTLNNLNEVNKANRKAEQYLKRLSEDVALIKKDIDKSIDFMTFNFNGSVTVQSVLEKGYLDSANVAAFDRYLKRYYQHQLTFQDANTYNEMLSAGQLNLIRNKWIRDSFSDLADTREFLMEITRSAFRKSLQDDGSFKKYIRYKLIHQNTDSATHVATYDFDEMKEDPVFINEISKQAKMWLEIRTLFERFRDGIIQMQDSITSEMQHQ
ncbi:MAG: DUF6090 family protein [Bacteroidota bacterium]